MKKILQHKKDIFIITILIGLYLLTRLPLLTSVPMFTDEAIYMRWSQVGQRDSAWRYIPLTDGKPPLYHWSVMIVMGIGIFDDPLFEGRIVSVGAGFISLIFMMLISWVLFKKKHFVYLAALFYILSPMMVVYDRLAIVDSLLTTTSLASFFFAILLVKYLRLDVALLFGMAVGSAMLTKASGLIFLLMSPATVLLRDWKFKKKQWLKSGAIWIGYLLLAFILAHAIYAILLLSQFYYRIEQKNYEFIVPLSEFLASPFSMTWGNMKSLFRWQVGYLTLPVSAMVIYGLSNFKRWREVLVLSAYWFAPFVMIASFNKIIFPRFLLFSTPYLFFLALIGLEKLYKMIELKNKSAKSINVLGVQITATVLVFSFAGLNTFLWTYNPAQAQIPLGDKEQYFSGQPSGIGVNEIVEIVSEDAEDGPVFLGTDGTFGLTPDAFLVYFIDNPNVQVEGYYPVDVVPEEVVAKAEEMPTYFVYYNVQDIPDQENIELIGEYAKVTESKTTYLRLYRVKSFDQS